MAGAITVGAATLYALTAGPAQWAAVRDPAAGTVRRAVGAGIHSLVPLQAALTARAGAPWTAAALALGLPAARTLAKRVSPT